MGDTVAAEFLGLTWAEFRPEAVDIAEAGEGPLAIRSGLSGVVPVDDGADEGVGAVAVGVDVEVVGVVVVVREFNARVKNK